MTIQLIPPFVQTEKNTPSNLSQSEAKSVSPAVSMESLDLASAPVYGPKNKVDTFHNEAGTLHTSSPKDTYAAKPAPLTVVAKIKNVLTSATKGFLGAAACVYGALKGLAIKVKNALTSFFAKSPAQKDADVNKALSVQLPGSSAITDAFFTKKAAAKDALLNKENSAQLPGTSAITDAFCTKKAAAKDALSNKGLSAQLPDSTAITDTFFTKKAEEKDALLNKENSAQLPGSSAITE